MTTVILSDENCGGHAREIFHALKRLGYLEWISMELKLFEDVGLPMNADDETAWRFCQEQGYILLTGNRTAKHGQESLEMTIRRLVTATSLPVVTIGDLERVLKDKTYCERCAHRLAEITFDLEERYLGITRLYLT